MCASGNACLERDPARVAPHDFNHHDSVVRFGCGMDFVDRVGGGVQRGIEPESDFGGREIVVDGLGNADDVHALLEKVECNLL